MNKITNKTIFSQVIFIFTILYIISCTTDPVCKSQNNISGDIIEVLNLGKCYNLMQQDTFVINDSSSFMLLENLIDPEYYEFFKNSCDTLSDTINFNKYTVIGYFANGHGCNVNFHKDFQMDTLAKKCTYTITIEECGNCSTEEFNMNWVVVPKIGDEYEINFIKEIM